MAFARQSAVEISDYVQHDVDVAARCVGIRADFVGFVDQRFGCGPVDAGKCHVELHGEAEALGLARADADGCGGGCVSGNLGVLAASSDDLIACDGIIASQAGRQPLRFNRARFIFDA